MSYNRIWSNNLIDKGIFFPLRVCSYWHLVDAKAKMSGFDMHLYCKKVFYYLFIFGKKFLFVVRIFYSIITVIKFNYEVSSVLLTPKWGIVCFFSPVKPFVKLFCGIGCTFKGVSNR